MKNTAPQQFDVSVYHPRNPQANGYYRCVQDHFEQLEMLWQDRYAPRYGFWLLELYPEGSLIDDAIVKGQGRAA